MKASHAFICWRVCRVLFSTPSTVLLSSLLIAARTHADADVKADSFSYFLSDNAFYDDNLFRIPTDSDIKTTVNRNASRDDVINQLSLSGDLQSFVGRQGLTLQAHIDDNRYAHNDAFDNVSGAGELLWDWVLGSFSSGTMGVDYERRLSRFADAEFFQKDMVTGKDYFFDFKEKISPHWRFTGGVNRTDVDHSASERTVDNFVTRKWRVGLAYETLAASSAGIDYAQAKTDFPDDDSVAADSREYRDTSLKTWWKYAYSVKTQLELETGYLRRRYDAGGSGDFSGNSSRVTLLWNPAGSLEFDIAAWHELHAFREAGSEYFVADGISIAPSVSLSKNLRLLGDFAYEHRDYKNSDTISPLDEPSRSDKFIAMQLDAKYEQTRFLTWGLSFRRERRLSNQDASQYDDNTTMLSVKFLY